MLQLSSRTKKYGRNPLSVSNERGGKKSNNNECMGACKVNQCDTFAKWYTKVCEC